ncbi:MAG: proline dehydrogenase [Saprospiraceae bacterium]|nr:proline dehydrogenase family protein [Bacteroidia bacterium]NNL91686.1 proline dehydrogenase [Saprospiraceae bacterium]
MNNKSLVKMGSLFTPTALKLKLPFVRSAIKATIFKQFVGGENLLDTQKSIDLLYRYNTLTILDYGAESKTSEDDLDNVMNETINAIELAASNSSVPVVSTKLTGLAPNELLIKVQSDEALNESEKREYDKLVYRLDAICKRAHDLKVGIMIDAEESWMQISIDDLVNQMMAAYNKSSVIVYNTFQLYRNDKLDYLKLSHEQAIAEGYLLGAKLVRGAYMEKERNYAEENGLKDVINATKEDTDRDYNEGIKYCVDNYESIASVCASHNVKSNLYQAQLIEENQIEKTHPHLNFCQLFGMSDNITFNLAKSGYNVAKYLPYGPLNEVVPYLIRRAQENTSITGDMSRELKFIAREIKRRGL